MRNKTMVFVALFLLLGVGSQVATAQEEFKPITVFLIRHAEREDEPRQDPPLKKEGIARSQELARMLSAAGIKAIFTSQFARTKQTAEPLATKLGLTATSFTLKSNPSNPRQIAAESTAEVTNKILERSGESVLVIGHSNSIPDVIKMLGGDVVPTIDEKKFDDLFIVTAISGMVCRQEFFNNEAFVLCDFAAHSHRGPRSTRSRSSKRPKTSNT